MKVLFPIFSVLLVFIFCYLLINIIMFFLTKDWDRCDCEVLDIKREYKKIRYFIRYTHNGKDFTRWIDRNIFYDRTYLTGKILKNDLDDFRTFTAPATIMVKVNPRTGKLDCNNYTTNIVAGVMFGGFLAFMLVKVSK